MKNFLNWLGSFIAPPHQPDDQTIMDTTQNKPTLIDFCLAIRDYEGQPGDLNYRNNNPGNCRCSKVGYRAIYGNVLCEDNFAVFPTEAQGMLYLENLIKQKIEANPTWTIYDYFALFHAPASDGNNPTLYANWVAGKLGVPVTTLVDTFLT